MNSSIMTGMAAAFALLLGALSFVLARLRGLKVIPGMPVEAFIQTESRTVLSYLLKPLRDQVMRTFRES